jgi:2-oxoglutarate dehydrogenase E2 component (dihydrolipoamide succinyltransferase)
MTEVKIPEMGESVSSGYLAAWLKQEGDSVVSGEEILELETDKATLSVPSPGSGVLSILVPEGEEVEIGQIVARLEPAISISTLPEHYSPSVRQVMHSYGLSELNMEGSGKKGHLTKEDVLAYVEKNGLLKVSTDVSQAKDSGKKKEELKGSDHSAPAPPEEIIIHKDLSERVRRKKMSRIRQTIAANLVESRKESAHLTTFNEVDMSAVMDLRNRYKEDFHKNKGVKLGFMSFFVKAVCTALIRYPQLNAIIDGDDLVFRNYRNIGIAVSTEKGLITPVLKEADTLSFAEIELGILSFATRAADKKLLPDDLSGGTFTITNGGVFGSLLSTPIPSPGQSGILGMHSIVKKPVVRNDEIVIRPMMYVALTYDHRIVDGREAVGFLNIVKDSIEDPGRLLIDL